MAPRDVCILVPRTCEYVILYGKKGRFCWMWWRIMRCGQCVWLFRWAQCNHKGPYQKKKKKRAGVSKSEGRGVWAEVRVMCSEDEGRSHESRSAASRSWERQGQGYTLEPAEEMQPCQRPNFRTSALQNCQRIPFCCRKPLSVVTCYLNNRKWIHCPHPLSLLFLDCYFQSLSPAHYPHPV